MMSAGGSGRSSSAWLRSLLWDRRSTRCIRRPPPAHLRLKNFRSQDEFAAYHVVALRDGPLGDAALFEAARGRWHDVLRRNAPHPVDDGGHLGGRHPAIVLAPISVVLFVAG